MKKSLGMILAATVGSFIATNAFATAAGGTAPQSAEPSVKCMGANACKGQSACKTASNACKGKNNCKGTGMIMTMTDAECKDKGGKVMTAADVPADKASH